VVVVGVGKVEEGEDLKAKEKGSTYEVLETEGEVEGEDLEIFVP